MTIGSVSRRLLAGRMRACRLCENGESSRELVTRAGLISAPLTDSHHRHTGAKAEIAGLEDVTDPLERFGVQRIGE